MFSFCAISILVWTVGSMLLLFGFAFFIDSILEILEITNFDTSCQVIIRFLYVGIFLMCMSNLILNLCSYVNYALRAFRWYYISSLFCMLQWAKLSMELLRVNSTFFVLSCLAILVVVTKGSIQFKDIKFLILLVSCLLLADNYEIGLCI